MRSRNPAVPFFGQALISEPLGPADAREEVVRSVVQSPPCADVELKVVRDLVSEAAVVVVLGRCIDGGVREYAVRLRGMSPGFR